jgi:KipI family sensor histidine kinase inhibitor
MRVLPMGRDAVVIEDLGADPAAWSLGLRALELPGVVDVVPAATTVLVTCASPADLERTVATFDGVRAARIELRDGGTTEIPVRYGGPDLGDVAEHTGLSVPDVVALHAAATYEVAFCGFAPGFGYLRGLPPELHLPRRSDPRTNVPAGSVAIAAEYSAVYPRTSPGGWHLIGSTDMLMFDPAREPPALLTPGSRVRFVAT